MDEKSTPAIGKKLLAGALAIGAVFGAAGFANAATHDDSTPTPASQLQDDNVQLQDGALDESLETDADEADEHDRGSSEELLTGTVADQVTAAALAAVPGGTIDRVETDDGEAAYEAHTTDADGNRVTVTFDESFNVLATEAGGGRGDHDGERGDHDHAPLDPAVAEQVTAAAQLAVPGGTVTKVEQEDAGFEAHVIGTDGVEVEVYFDADMNVLAID